MCLYYSEEGLFDRPKYWLSLFISLYIFGFLFVVWRWFFFTLFYLTYILYLSSVKIDQVFRAIALALIIMKHSAF